MANDVEQIAADCVLTLRGMHDFERDESYVVYDLNELFYTGTLKPEPEEVQATCHHCEGTGFVTEWETPNLPDRYIETLKHLVQIAKRDGVSMAALEFTVSREFRRDARLKRFQDDPALIRNYWVDALHKSVPIP